MNMLNANCPECGSSIEYWTKRSYFECPNCGQSIVVKLIKRNLECEGIVYAVFGVSGLADNPEEVFLYYEDGNGNEVNPEDLGNGELGIYVDGKFVPCNKKLEKDVDGDD